MPVKKKKKISKKNAFVLAEDLFMIAIGITIALILSKTGLLDIFLSTFNNYYIIAAFISGIFFTSVFTMAPAAIALVHVAEKTPVQSVALWGALGAMCGDLVLLYFIRDRFLEHMIKMMRRSTVKRISKFFHFGFMKWLSPIIGALIIPSPLPDEFALSLLGVSNIRMAIILPIIFSMNVVGIYILVAFANLIS